VPLSPELYTQLPRGMRQQRRLMSSSKTTRPPRRAHPVTAPGSTSPPSPAKPISTRHAHQLPDQVIRAGSVTPRRHRKHGGRKLFVLHHEILDRLSQTAETKHDCSLRTEESATDLALEHDLDSTDPLAALVEGLNNP